MKWFSLQLADAGFGHFSAKRIGFVWLVTLVFMALAVGRITGLAGMAVAAFFLGGALSLEALKGLAQARFNALIAALPEVAESIASAVASGQELVQAIADLATNGPKSLRQSFVSFMRLDALGIPLDQALDWLSIELSNVYADQLVELLRVSSRNGGFGLVDNLNQLARNLRQQVTLQGELQAKQGWVTGTAKLALAAPWAIVYLLAARGQNAIFYNSTLGLSMLMVGLVVCLFAYLLIGVLGRMPSSRRVFVR